MTLQNGLITAQAAYLWSDTAFWDPATGKLMWHDTKIFQGTEWPWAGSVSTVGPNPHEIAFGIGREHPRDLDQLIYSASSALQKFCAEGHLGRVLIAACIPEPILFRIASDAIGPTRPFEPAFLEYQASSGNSTQAYKTAERCGMDVPRMRRIIDAQIAEPFDGAGQTAHLGRDCWIGGNVVELEVRPEGMSSHILRTVPDRSRALEASNAAGQASLM